MPGNAREELVEFLVRRAFDPVLKAKPDGRAEAERKKLRHVQHATRAEIERFRHYRSAEEVVVNFRRDLDSQPARRIHAELEQLDLPTINGLRDAFERKARELGVDAAS